MNLDTIGGRRFLLTLGCGAVTALLQYLGKLDPAGTTYSLVTIATVAAYITGNVAQRIKAPPP
jgi:hypothetical protein